MESKVAAIKGGTAVPAKDGQGGTLKGVLGKPRDKSMQDRPL